MLAASGKRLLHFPERISEAYFSPWARIIMLVIYSCLTNYLKPSGFTQIDNYYFTVSEGQESRNNSARLRGCFEGCCHSEVWSEARIGLQPH